MEQQDKPIKNKGGRRPKAIKKDQFLGVKCTSYERKLIEAKAKSVNLTTSEYLCEMGKTGQIDRRIKSLPKEILEMTGIFNHMAANFNQIAKKRNGIEELSLSERTTLQEQVTELKELVIKIKSFFQ